MAITPVNLYRGQPGASIATIYTAGSSSGDYTIVKEILACNTDVADRYLSIYTVDDQHATPSAGAYNAILYNVRIPAQTTAFFSLSCVLEQDDFIAAAASAADVITLTVSGVEGGT